MTEQWNGSSWSVVTSPNKGAQHNFLNGLAKTPGGALWAVGVQFTPSFV